MLDELLQAQGAAESRRGAGAMTIRGEAQKRSIVRLERAPGMANGGWRFAYPPYRRYGTGSSALTGRLILPGKITSASGL